PRSLPPFPTRRSSDLVRSLLTRAGQQVEGGDPFDSQERAKAARGRPAGRSVPSLGLSTRAIFARPPAGAIRNVWSIRTSAANSQDRKSTRLNSSHVSI